MTDSVHLDLILPCFGGPLDGNVLRYRGETVFVARPILAVNGRCERPRAAVYGFYNPDGYPRLCYNGDAHLSQDS